MIMPGSAPFCRAEDRAATLITAKGVGHIAGHAEGAVRKFRDNVLVRDAIQYLQTLGTEGHLLAFAVQKPVTERL